MRLTDRKRPLYIVASILSGFKTYIVYSFILNIVLSNFMQELILFINAFVSALLFFALRVWLSNSSRQLKFIRYFMLIGSLIIYFNLIFYRSFTDFLTIPQLFQTSNVADLGSSILSLIKVYDVFIFADVAIIWHLSKKSKQFTAVQYPRSGKVFALAISLVLLAGNFLLAEMERPQLFTRAFDREYLVKNIGLFNYHIFDIFGHSKVKTQKVFADGNELPAIEKHIEDTIRSSEKSSIIGISEDKKDR